MNRSGFEGFFVGRRFERATKKHLRRKPNCLSRKRQRAAWYARVNTAMGGDYIIWSHDQI